MPGRATRCECSVRDRCQTARTACRSGTPSPHGVARTHVPTTSSTEKKGCRPERLEYSTRDAESEEMSTRSRGDTTDQPRAHGPASMDSRLDSLPDVTLQHLTSHHCAVDVALRVDAETLRTGMIGAC